LASESSPGGGRGLRAPKPTTLRVAWEAWHEGAKAGTIRNRSGDRYKPSAIRGYDQGMRLPVLPEFGAVRLADLDRIDLQRFVHRLQESGLAPTTIEVTLLPVRAMYRQAIERGEMPGSEAEAAGLLDAYLAAEFDRSAEQARAATCEQSGEQLANEPEKALTQAGSGQ
jgi:hypothetical protein